MCECYKIGGPWISFDPDCPAHGYEAQERAREVEQLESDVVSLRAEVAAWRERFPQYVYRPQDDVVALR